MNTPHSNSHNPYAAPVAENQFAPGPPVSEQAIGSYYAMSVTKLWIMSVLTFGLYNLVFFYRHWRHQRDEHGHSVSPFWRAVFSPFMYFGLNQQISEAARFAAVPVSTLLGSAPFVYFVANALGRVLDRVYEESTVGVDLLTYALIPVGTYALALTQSAVNRILEKEGYVGPSNSGVTAGSIIFGALGAVLWAGAALGLSEGL